MFKKKRKPISPEDVTEEDIRRQINRHKLLNKRIESHVISKSLTFLMLFSIWLFLTISVKSLQLRYFLILVCFPILILILQAYIVNPKKKFS